jgi:hypothetical protein
MMTNRIGFFICFTRVLFRDLGLRRSPSTIAPGSRTTRERSHVRFRSFGNRKFWPWCLEIGCEEGRLNTIIEAHDPDKDSIHKVLPGRIPMARQPANARVDFPNDKGPVFSRPSYLATKTFSPTAAGLKSTRNLGTFHPSETSVTTQCNVPSIGLQSLPKHSLLSDR